MSTVSILVPKFQETREYHHFRVSVTTYIKTNMEARLRENSISHLTPCQRRLRKSSLKLKFKHIVKIIIIEKDFHPIVLVLKCNITTFRQCHNQYVGDDGLVFSKMT